MDSAHNSHTSLSSSHSANYSHGLESVYAFETIDPLSVRKLQRSSSLTPIDSSSIATPTQTSALLLQNRDYTSIIARKLSNLKTNDDITLPFSPYQLLTNLRFLEPIEALELSSFLTAKLRQKKLMSLRSAYNYILLETQSISTPERPSYPPSHFKRDKLASSQLEEIETAIKNHTYGAVKKVPFIEWPLVASLFFITLSQKEEEEAISLFSLDKCLAYSQHLFKTSKERLSTEEREKIRGALKEYIDTVFFVRISPWIQSLAGYTHQHELEAYLDELSLNSYITSLLQEAGISAQKTHDPSSEYYQFIAWCRGEKFLFDSHLLSCFPEQSKIIACGKKAQLNAETLIKAIYEICSLVSKDELCEFIASPSLALTLQRELAKNWNGEFDHERIKAIAYFLLLEGIF